MTEAEWLASDDPEAMEHCLVAQSAPGHVDGIVSRPSDRKLRLWACAYFRNLPPRHGDWSRLVEAIGWSEKVADGLPYSEVPADATEWQPCSVSGHACATWVITDVEDDPEQQRFAASLLRDIVGNPFRPVTPPPVERSPSRWHGREYEVRQPWLTPLVVSLAQAAYDERTRKCERCGGKGRERDDGSFSGYGVAPCRRCDGKRVIDDGTLDPFRLAILADALEEAGCIGEPEYVSRWDSDFDPGRSSTNGMISRRVRAGNKPHPIVAHLRGPGPHVRGCFAIDAILDVTVHPVSEPTLARSGRVHILAS